MNFHFVIFSRLQSYDGGRETWINLFLPLLQKSLPQSTIYVYHYSDSKTDKTRMIGVYNDERFSFFDVPLPRLRNKLFSILRIFLFLFPVVKLINKNINTDCSGSKNILLGIGSFYEAFALMLYKKFHPRKNIKSIVWLRGVWAKETYARHKGLIHRVTVFYEKLFLKNADTIIANGIDTYKAYKDIGFESIIIPNAIDLNKYSNKVDFIKPEVIVISYIGRLSLEKGLTDFLKSIDVFNTKHPDLVNKIRFEIVGDGPLINLVQDANYSNLKFIGPINNEKMVGYLQSITCGVALTYSQKTLGGAGVSNGLLELMASEKLIICWDSPVFKQVLDNQSSIMVDESDYNSLAFQYQKIVEDYDSLTIRSKNARELSFLYSKESHMAKFSKVINEFEN